MLMAHKQSYVTLTLNKVRRYSRQIAVFDYSHSSQDHDWPGCRFLDHCTTKNKTR